MHPWVAENNIFHSRSGAIFVHNSNYVALPCDPSLLSYSKTKKLTQILGENTPKCSKWDIAFKITSGIPPCL